MSKNAKKDDKTVQNVSKTAEKPEETRIIYMDVADLKAYEKNPRKNGPAVEKVAASIREFGFKVPVVIDRDRTIVCGHTRVMAARKLKMGRVPCIVADDLTDEQVKAYRLADNKVAEFSEWDVDLLEGELDAIGIDMTQFGFDPFEEEQPEIVEDEIPEEVEPMAKLGDIFRLGEHRLMCGDSTSHECVTKLLEGVIPDMVFTDPPYGINLNGDNSKRGGANSIMKGGLKLKSFIDDSTEYACKAFDIVQDLKVKKQVWFGANYYCHHLPETNNWLIWDKRVEEKMTNTNSDCEMAWVLDGHQSCRIFRYLWNGLIKAGEKGEKRVHPTQKPIALVSYCVEKYAPEAKKLLDLFGGSGSSLIAAEQLGIKCFMMELDPHYCDVIIARWEKLTGGKAELVEDSKTTQRDTSRHDATTK